MARPALDHGRVDRQKSVDHSVEVHIDDAIPVGAGQLLRRSAHRDSRVGEEEVGYAGIAEDSLPVVLVSDIETVIEFAFDVGREHRGLPRPELGSKRSADPEAPPVTRAVGFAKGVTRPAWPTLRPLGVWA